MSPDPLSGGLYTLAMLAAAVIGVLWTLLPFAVFGTKARLDESIRLQRDILDELRRRPPP